MIYSRHKEDAGRDRRVSSRNGVCSCLVQSGPAVVSSFLNGVLVLSVRKGWLWKIFLIQEIRSHVVNLVSRTVSAYYLPKRPIAPSLGLSPDKRNKRDLGEQTDL